MAAFTTMAAGVGAATALGGGLMSFGQSAKASKQAADAQKKADRLMAEARKNAQKDVYAKLQVPLDAFNEQYRQTNQAATAGIQALQEGDSRTLAAGIGQISGAVNEATEKTRIDKAEALFGLEKDKATSQENIKQQLIAMDSGAAKDAEMKAADQEKIAASSLQQGISQVGKGAVGVAGMTTSLFGKGQGEDGKLSPEELEALMKYLGS